MCNLRGDLTRVSLGVLLALGMLLPCAPRARAGETTAKAETTTKALPAAMVTKPATKPGAKPAAQKIAVGSGSAESSKPVTTSDQLTYDQERVLAEMSELEERMFRLSESLHKIEPENASRLVMAVKLSREELILHQMQETRDVLKKLMLSDAVSSQKDVLAKLERLQQLLLSSDLDLRLRLERVRLMKEVIKKLEVVIKEQEAEKRASERLAADQRKLEGLRKKQATLTDLVKQQTAHNETSDKLRSQTAPPAKQSPDASKPSAEKAADDSKQAAAKAPDASKQASAKAPEASKPATAATPEPAKPAEAAKAALAEAPDAAKPADDKAPEAAKPALAKAPETAKLALAKATEAAKPAAAPPAEAAKPSETAKSPEAAKPEAAKQPDDVSKLSAAQQKTRQDTLVLSRVQNPQEKPNENLEAAEKQMQGAVEKLDKKELAEAAKPMESALEALKKELDETDKQAKKLAAKVEKQKFAALRKQQEGTRKSTVGLQDMVRQLGESGAGALSELNRATGSMASAEGRLGQMNAGGAGENQEQALAALKYSKEQLEDELQRLLDELRADLKQKTLETLTWMLEQQIEVRKSTVNLAGKLKAGSRLALTSLVGLGKNEAKMITAADELIGLIEETEFGIALPAALTAVRDEMDDVRASLDQGDGSPPVVDTEKQVEADLKELIGAMKQLPSSGNPNGKGRRGNAGRPDQQKQLNKMVAELKLIRLLQSRVNRGTTEADRNRPKSSLPNDLRKKIEDLSGRQEDIRDVTERLAAERNLME